MSHGKRMLKAQSKRDTYNGSSTDDTASDLAYLRSNRAFAPDGTPNRPPRREDNDEDAYDDNNRSSMKNRANCSNNVSDVDISPVACRMTEAPKARSRSQQLLRSSCTPAVSPVPPPRQRDDDSPEPLTRNLRRQPQPTTVSLPSSAANNRWSPHTAANNSAPSYQQPTRNNTNPYYGKQQQVISSPPLRAAVSPRALAQHLSRLDSSAHSSLSLGESMRTTPPAIPTGGATQQFIPHHLRDTTASVCTPPSLAASNDIPQPPFLRVADAPASVEESSMQNTAMFPTSPLGSSSLLPPPANRSPGVSSSSAVPRSSPYRSDSGPDEHEEEESESGDNLLDGVLDQRVPDVFRILDLSGFRNQGNDCYACSVLTLLLRSTAFRKAFLSSPPVKCLLRYVGGFENVKARSGYTDRKRNRKRNRDGRRGSSSSNTSSSSSSSSEDDDDSSLDSDMIEVDEDGSVQPSVHGALLSLLRQQCERETLYSVMHDKSIDVDQRRRLLTNYMLRHHVVDDDTQQRHSRRAPRRNLYNRGISMNPLEQFFDAEFFTGEQEDAHEFLVSLVAKVESEAEAWERKRMVLRGEVTTSDGGSEERDIPPESNNNNNNNNNSNEDSNSDKERDEDDDVHSLPTTCEMSTASPVPPPTTPVPCGESEVAAAAAREGDADAEEEGEASSTVATTRTTAQSALTSNVWVNRLMQGRLLNIIRCRNPECGHHIASEELFINLSVTPMAVAPTTTKPDSVLSTVNIINDDDSDDDTLGATISKNSSQPPEIASLLTQSLQYEQLDEYSCDKCHQSRRQFQGACFLGSPPPVLLVQLKRFTVSFVGGSVSFTKDSREVHINDRIEVYAMPHRELGTPSQRPSTSHKEEGGDYHVCTGGGVDESPCYYDDANKVLTDTVLKAEQSAIQRIQRDRNKSFLSEADDFFSDEVMVDILDEGPAADKQKKQGEENCDADNGDTVDAIRCVYELKGSVLHLGSTLYFGHYIAEFACPRNKNHDNNNINNAAADKPPSHPWVWRCANDERVITMNPMGLAERRDHCDRSYLLMYEKVLEERVRCPVDKVLPTPI